MKTPTPKIFIILTAALLAGSGPAFSQTTSTLYNSGGNIGIGTTTPQMALTVTSGTVGIGTWSPTVAGDTMLDVFKSDSAVANDPGNSQIRATAKGGANPRFTSIGYDTALNVGYIQAAEKGVAWRDLLLEANGGNVGIGTTSPGYKLDVFGTASVRVGTDQRARFTSESSTVSFAGVNDAANAFVTLKLEGNPLVLNSQSGGNVGIGTTLPRATLEVANFVGLQLEYNIGSQGGAFTITSTNGNKQKVTLTGTTAHTVTWTAPSSGLTANFIIKVVQGSGSDTLTWPATVKWAGGSAPTLTTTNGATDILGFYFDGTNFWGAAIVLNGS